MPRAVRAGLLIALAMAAPGLWALFTSGGVKVGNALELGEGGVIGFSGGERHVGQELILVFGDVENESSSAVVLTGITFDDGTTENVEFVEIGLIPQEVDGHDFLLGTYQSSPPTFLDFDDTCVSHEVEPFQRRLEPGEIFHIAYHVRFADPGAYRFEYPRIHYLSGFRHYYEVLQVELSGDVKDSRKDAPLNNETNAPCMDEDDLLPGNRLNRE